MELVDVAGIIVVAALVVALILHWFSYRLRARSRARARPVPTLQRTRVHTRTHSSAVSGDRAQMLGMPALGGHVGTAATAGAPTPTEQRPTTTNWKMILATLTP
jgi:hypothetical protein